MLRAPLLLFVSFALISSAACGSDDGTEHSGLLVEIRATRGENEIEVQDGVAELSSDVRLYDALVRLAQVQIVDGLRATALDLPRNVDLLDGAIIAELEPPDHAMHRIEIVFASSQAGVGILPGEDAVLFIGGLLKDVPFELRAHNIPMVAAPIDSTEFSGGSTVTVGFDADDWLGDLDPADLVLTGGILLIDEENNAPALADVLDAFASSIGVVLDDEDISQEEETGD